MKRRKPFTQVGERFGSLVVTGPGRLTPRKKQNITLVPCRCDCGKESLYYPSNLRLGRSTACDKCRLVKFVQARRPRIDPARKICGCGGPKNCRALRCRGCAAARRRGKVGKGNTGPMTYGRAGELTGMSKQAVHQIVKKIGWDAFLERMA